MFKKVLVVLALLSFFSCSSYNNPPVEKRSLSETDRINAWFEARFEEELMFSPIALTYIGRKERYDEIDDFSPKAYRKQLNWQEKTVKEMEQKFNYERLTLEAKTSYDLWKYRYQIEEEGYKFRQHEYIFEQMSGAHSSLPTFLLSVHAVEDKSDMDAFIARITGIGSGIRQLLDNTKAAANLAIRPPRFAYDIVIEESLTLISGKPFDSTKIDSPVLENAKVKINKLLETKKVSAKVARQLLQQTRLALTRDFEPAYRQLITFLKQDLKNTSELALGVYALPEGLNFYNHQLRSMTTTSLSSDEIHEIGLTEVKRLRGEMESIKIESGFKGNLQDFFAFIRDNTQDRRFYYPDTDEGRQSYLDDAIAAIDNIKAQLPQYFGLLPKADLVVKRVEAFREQPGAAQHYFEGTPDGSRPGTYYAHLSDMSAMPKNQLEVIAYHEGLPGHHMQISIAQELKSIPTFRRQSGFTAYVEGWALYTELLAREMPNTYVDIYSSFGQLSSEIFRAIRLVVDTGLHAKGWSQEQAVNYFSENSPEPISGIRSEVMRYLVLPGQATSYKIGMLDILRLREKSRNALGDKFDIRNFHDTVLGGGALPLSLLERRIDNWIETYH